MPHLHRGETIDDQFRATASRRSGRAALASRIWPDETGLSEAQICRFLSGDARSSLESIDMLMDALGLEIVIRPRQQRKGD